MQDRYVADAGDFGKYALLHFLTKQSGLSLGIIWYYTTPEGFAGREIHLNDGRHRAYKDIADLDLRLFAKLQSLKTVGEVEKSNIFSRGARFFRGELPYQNPRSDWFQKAEKATAKSELIFLDPDNGFEVESASGRRWAKYVQFAEVAQLFRNGKSVIVYQHRPRKTLAEVEQRVRAGLVNLPKPIVLSYHRGTPREYFIFLQPHHKKLLKPAIQDFRNKWDGPFS